MRKAALGDLGNLSELLEPRNVVRVRAGAALQTAFCIFQNCPHVQALVSIDGEPCAVRTTTREFFTAQLLHCSLLPCIPSGAQRKPGGGPPDVSAVAKSLGLGPRCAPMDDDLCDHIADSKTLWPLNMEGYVLQKVTDINSSHV